MVCRRLTARLCRPHDHSRPVLHLRQGERRNPCCCLAPPSHVFTTCLTVLCEHGRCEAQVIGNKWDTYLDLLQAEYSEG